MNNATALVTVLRAKFYKMLEGVFVKIIKIT